MTDNVHQLTLFRHPALYDRMNRLLGFRALYDRVVNDVTDAEFPAGSRILDVGTGPGHVPIALARRRPDLHIEAIDVVPEMISHARQMAGPDSNVHFECTDVRDLPHPDGSFDLVIASMSLHHWSEPIAGMREVRRVLHEAGQVWIYDFRFFSGRVERAARAAFPRHTLHRERLNTLVGRLVAVPA